MLSEKLGHSLDRYVGIIAGKIPFAPNTITAAGFVITAVASVVLVGNATLGGILVLVGGVFDMLDGAVARLTGKATRFGAFLDSVLDRYADAAIFLAVGLSMIRAGDAVSGVLSLAALAGAFLVSYTRARAEGLGVSCRHGLMERPERILCIAFGLITGLTAPVLWLLAVLTHITAIQRIFHVRKEISGRGEP